MDDLGPAEDSIFHAVKTNEKTVLHRLENFEHAIENALRNEVDIMFHKTRKSKENEQGMKGSMKKPTFVREKKNTNVVSEGSQKPTTSQVTKEIFFAGLGPHR